MSSLPTPKKLPPALAEKLRAHGPAYLEMGSDARIDDMAERAGIPRATLYYHFSGRDELLAYFMHEKLTRLAAAVAAALAGDAPPLDRFHDAVEALAADFAATPAMCVQLTTAMGRAETMAPVLEGAEAAVFAPLRAALAAGVADGSADCDDVGLAVELTVGGLAMTVARRWLEGTLDAEHLPTTAAATALDGLRRRRTN